ncbi:MAG: glycosyltransferase family 2 protein [Bdellovibrionales bacterium]|nr:glycosyltransferase family 2 protein [Bdellovibrionales bacterium]
MSPNNRGSDEYADVTVVVPTYNQSRYLSTCLDSLMHQSLPPQEIVVVNDASPDDTTSVFQEYVTGLDETRAIVTHLREGEILRESLPRYPRPRPEIRYIENKVNLGATRSYRLGYEAASRRFVTHIPSDDYVMPRYIEKLYCAAKEGYDFVYSNFLLVDDAHRILLEYRLPEFDFRTSLADWYRLGCSYLLSSARYREAGGFDDNYRVANDYDLFLRVAMQGGRFKHIEDFLYYKRTHDNRKEGQWSPESENLMFRESALCAERARDFLSKNPRV